MGWRNYRRSGNVSDRRGRGGGGLAVGGGGAVLIALIAMFFGIDPRVILGGDPGAGQTQTAPAQQSQRSNELAEFMSVMLATTEDVWNPIFQNAGVAYRDPGLVLYTQLDRSACGTARAAMGPFYCPLDENIYIDLNFFEEMRSRFGVEGDYAFAYVLAHEVGHHVQGQLGILEQVQREQQRLPEQLSNQVSVRTELQADCFAGIWANAMQRDGRFAEVGIQRTDIASAVAAAEAVGDDRLQQSARGYVVPDSFTHGSSAQRVRWFQVGERSGDPDSCETFRQPYEQL